jgi:phosphoribosylformylglycinamidine synthase
VVYDDETVAFLSMDFLHDGAPDLRLSARWEPPEFPEPSGPRPDDLSATLVAMAGRLNLCSGEAKARHYDHEVKGLTVVKPWVGVRSDVPAEATVFLARHGSTRGFVLSEGVNPFYSDIDTEAMAAAVVDEAVRRQVCAGARLDRIALLDNFCWPDPVESEGTPDGAYKLAQLVRACRGLYETCRAYGTPLISGKDSMKNESTMGGVKISVPPTLLVSAIGQIDDVRDAVTLDFKDPDDVIFLVGATRHETGGSEYFRYLGDRDGRDAPTGGCQPWVGNSVPRLDPAETLPLYRALHGAIREGLVSSATVPSRGGLAMALVRSALAGRLGLDVDLGETPDAEELGNDVVLFSESCGRFVVTTSPDRAEVFEARFAGLACRRIGKVVPETRLVVRMDARAIVDIDLADVEAAYKETLADA